jgi:beta-lactam-binding protein with PASTA domain
VVPNVVDQTFDDAKATLEAQGLTVADPKYKPTDAAAEGIVLAQDPAADQRVGTGAVVTLTVAKAPTTVEVPPLRDLTLAEAQTALEAVGLRIGTPTDAADPTVAVGHIVSSDPAEGSLAKKGAFVDVVVSTGPELVAVPDVTTGCLSLGAAKHAINVAGLVPQVGPAVPPNPDCVNANRIAAQDPLAGTMVPAGSTVTIAQGSGGSPTP